MTKENRITIEAADITAVEIECTGCHNRIVRPAATVWQKEIYICPGCGASWIASKDLLTSLGSAVFELRRVSEAPHAGVNSPFTIRLQLANDGDKG
jgi:predicted RNA-binding Zn-ribbon protein involved in translation (DUF1610 family)